MPVSYSAAPVAGNDPPPVPERPWSVSPAAWLATLRTIREHAAAPTWWQVWHLVRRRRPSLPADGVTFRVLYSLWDRERQARGLESLGPWSMAEPTAREGQG